MKEQTEVGKLKEGRYVVVDEEPCKILGISVSKRQQVYPKRFGIPLLNNPLEDSCEQ